MTSSYEELKQISKSQTRQQIVLIVLSIAVAISSVVTWRSTSAMREANELQREWLASQKSGSPRTAALTHRSSARVGTPSVRSESQHPPAGSNAQERMTDRETTSGRAPDARVASTNPVANRLGRQ